jgi:GntR family transcriptional regulator
LYRKELLELSPVLTSPELDFSGPVPIYQQIKEWMRLQIASGIWPPAHKLKAEADLAIEWDVSRGTVRKAMAELANEGLLVRTHGRGTYVAGDVLEQPLADRLVTFSEDLISKGIPFQTLVLERKLIQATGSIATSLALSQGTKVFALKRVRFVSEKPLILLHNYVVHDHCQDIETIDFTHHRLFEALEEHCGLILKRGHRSFQAQIASRDVADLLDITDRDPVMHIEQLTYLDDGSLVEFSDLWLRGDQFRLSAVVKRSSPGEAGLSVSLSEQF